MRALLLVLCVLPCGCGGKSETRVSPPPQSPAKSTQETAVAAPAVKAEPVAVRFDIGGMKIGDPLTDEFRRSHCPGKYNTDTELTCNDKIDLAGGSVFVIYFFKQDRLIGAGISFETELFPTVVASYTAKFGCEPHVARTEKITTGVGVEYLNEIVEWKTDSGLFTVSKYGSKVTSGNGVLSSPEALKNQQDKKDADAAKLKSKL